MLAEPVIRRTKEEPPEYALQCAQHLTDGKDACRLLECSLEHVMVMRIRRRDPGQPDARCKPETGSTSPIGLRSHVTTTYLSLL